MSGSVLPELTPTCVPRASSPCRGGRSRPASTAYCRVLADSGGGVSDGVRQWEEPVEMSIMARILLLLFVITSVVALGIVALVA